MRYSRQTLLPEIGHLGQEAIRASRILCVGVGGLGSPAAMYLAAAGVGTIGLIDPDAVDESNLQRQILFTTQQIGKSKAKVGQESLLSLNPQITVRSYATRLSSTNAMDILPEYDVVIDGTDSFQSKFLINDATYKLGIPLVYGAIAGFEGRISVFNTDRGPCYRCFQPTVPVNPIKNCAETGVLGALAGVIGSMQALETLKLVLGISKTSGRLIVYDGLAAQMSEFGIFKNKSCPTCSQLREDVILAPDSLAPFCALTPDDRAIHSEDLKKQGKAWTLIDVREPEEWKTSHLPFSQNWPLSRIENGNFPMFDLDPTKKYILYCSSGIRSAKALAIILKHEGLPRASIYHLKGGLASCPHGIHWEDK